LQNSSGQLSYRYVQYICALNIAPSAILPDDEICKVYDLAFSEVATLFSTPHSENCDLICEAILKWLCKEKTTAKSFYAAVLLHLSGYLNKSKLLNIVCNTIEATMSLSDDLFFRSGDLSKSNLLFIYVIQ
jgi:D-serine deaminase-like pyridoxal phosphate-dependent protein